MQLVLHIITGLKVGGAEMLLHRLILTHKQNKYVHKVIALNNEGEMRARFLESNIKLYMFNLREKPISEFYRLVLLIKSLNPVIVQTWLYHSDLFGGIAARIAGCRNIIWGIRTTAIKECTKSIYIIRYITSKLSYIIPKKIVCAAQAAKNSHIKIGYCSFRMIVIPNGFKLDFVTHENKNINKLLDSFSIESNCKIIGMLGRFNKAKDQYNFIDAARILITKYPNLKFLIVGRDCDLSNAKIQSRVNSTGYPDRFILLGERKDTFVCLRAMDIFVLPSRNEGFPNVLAEAMSVSLPCVATDVGDAKILLSDCGIIVKSKNSNDLARGIELLVNMKSEDLDELKNKAYNRIKMNYSMEIMINKYNNLYKEVVA